MQILIYLWKWYVNLFLFTYREEWNRFSYFEFYWNLFGWGGAIQLYKDGLRHFCLYIPLGFVRIMIKECFTFDGGPRVYLETELIIRFKNKSYVYNLGRR